MYLGNRIAGLILKSDDPAGWLVKRPKTQRRPRTSGAALVQAAGAGISGQG